MLQTHLYVYAKMCIQRYSLQHIYNDMFWIYIKEAGRQQTLSATAEANELPIFLIII